LAIIAHYDGEPAIVNSAQRLLGKMALSIFHWSNYTKNKVKLTRKWEDAVNSDHILKFTFDSSITELHIAVY